MMAGRRARVDQFVGRWAGPIVALPEYTVVALAGFSVGPMILLLADWFVPAVALLLGVLGAGGAVLWYGRARSWGATRTGTRDGWWTLAALLFALVWAVANWQYSSQDVFAIRDPSTYMIAGRWLWDHHSLRIDSMPQVFGFPASAPGVVSGGFNNIQHTQTVYAQGNHLLPVLLGITGRFFGLTAMFGVNTIFAAVGLFALFGLIRAVAHSAPIALVATVALAVSTPYIYVSRDTYSEPLTMMFLVGGLLLLYRAWHTGRPRDFALATFVATCSAMVRVDSYAAFYGFVGAAAVLCLVAPPARRRHAALCAVAMLVGGLGPTLIGWADVAWLSRQYYWSQHSNITSLTKLLVGLVVLVPIVVAVGWLPAVRRLLIAPRTRTLVVRTLTSLTGVVFLVLLSRPLWYYQTKLPYNPVLARMQRGSGVKVDGTATYGQLTLNWLAWYLGWGTVLLAAAGYLLLVHRMLARRDYGLAGLLGTGMTLSALYLWNPQIYPDQPWAMRRYVPVVLPLLLVAAAVALTRLVTGEFAGRWRPAQRPARVVGWVLAALAAVFPAVILAPVWTLRQEYPQYLQLDALCKVLPSDAAVIEVDLGAQTGYAQSLRAFCHVPTYALIRQPGESDDQFRAKVAAVYRSVRAHGRELFSLSTDPGVLPLAPGTSQEPFSTIWTTRWPTRIGQVPHGPVRPTAAITVHMGRVDAEGYAHPVIGGPLYVTPQLQKRAGH